MKLLLLGGTGEARELASALHHDGHAVLYSVAGLTRLPELPCEIISGGFSQYCADCDGNAGVNGLAHVIRQRDIDLLVDATHPYAAQISAHAVAAARQSGIACWQLYRPGWPEAVKGRHTPFDSIAGLLPAIRSLQRPFFTLGASLLAHLDARPHHQHWIIRTLAPVADRPGISCLFQRGPFSLSAEIALLRRLRADALITKDSGGEQVVAKLTAAHELGIPVYIQRRPPGSQADRVFTRPAALLSALAACTHRPEP